ncbi:energy-coupling factor transporter ATPase [Bifidobacterium moukalabense]|uniref:Cobalt ABC transporter n=1 Tax=Bifidobacterium moukalabense DSM 27321 TaxID=1435051 RepID=W4NC44_9BIFI|nr:energy-coupling factor transporter ATPase [Bifidobacterium moukalabense]ETY72046.1 cobalt ABC transporter [Bifidobacterium moukalabense DSM 27321]
MPNIPVIELHDVRFSYDHGATWALDGVDLTILQGERVCLTGANGSGKSTLSRVIAGLVAPDSGTVTLLGNVAFDDSGAHADAYRTARHGIGAVFQHPEDQIVTTITEDDVAFGPENLAIAHDGIATRITASLEAVGMQDHRTADPTRLSGGQQQRVAIAGMLAMDSKVLVLDEPTAMLDPQARADIMHVLDDLQDHGTTIVLVTHHADELIHADRVIRLEQGRVANAGSGVDRPQPPAPSARSSREVEGPAESGLPQSDPIASAPIITVRDLTYRYPNADSAVFERLSLTIGRGEAVALMGRNGAGKTTLARMLCALETPQSGSIVIDGIPVARTTGSGASKPLSRKAREDLRTTVGFVMQHPERQLFAETVADDIAYGPRNQHLTESQVRERVEQALRLLHIEHLRDRSPFDLSGGQQRLVAIAGVIARNPRILIMDEPTAGLDEQATARVHELIRTLRADGVTTLIISHSQAEVDAIADRTITLESQAPQKTSAAARRNGHKPSFIGGLDPRVKMVSALALMFSAFAINSGWQLLLAAIFTGAIIGAAGLNPWRLLGSVHMFLMLFVFCGLLNVFFVRSGTIVARLGPIPITDDGIAIALLYACRFAVVIVLGATFLNTTTPTAMTDAFESLLSPWRRFGMHTQETALVMSLALRFLPTLGTEAKAIVDAQSARGGVIETGSPTQRIKAMTAIIIPVFAGAIRHADNLSLALDARCYEEGAERTHWRIMRITMRDIIAMAAIVVYLVALVALPALC